MGDWYVKGSNLEGEHGLVEQRNCPQGRPFCHQLIDECIREGRTLHVHQQDWQINTFTYEKL